MIQTFRQIYFALQKEHNRYLSDSVIKEYLCFVGNFKDFTTFFMHFDDKIEFDYSNEKLEELRKGRPVQQVTNYQYFDGHKIYVNDDVLIPRQETESLVKIMREKIGQTFADRDISLLDLCCGSGVIGLSISNSHISLTLSDISKEAIEVSKINAKMFEYREINFVVGDLFSKIDNKFDVIVCNPPYIENEANIDEQVKTYEPALALIAKPGHIFYERILREVSYYLKEKYLIGFEIEENQEDILVSLIKSYLPNSHFSFYKDICNKTRFVIIEG